MSWSAAGMLRARADADPAAVMLRLGEVRCSAGELATRAARVAAGLVALDVAPADRVAYLGRNSVEYFEVLLGAAMAGAVVVGVSWRSSGAEVEYLLADTEARVLFVDPDLEATACEAVRVVGRRVTVITVGAGGLRPGYREWSASHEARDPGIAVEPGDAAVQLYTSGTTGAAKGVVLSNRAIEATLAVVHRWGLDADATALVNLPLAHFGGTVWPLQAWSAGAACVVHPAFDATHVVADMRRDVTSLITVPTMLAMMCDEAERIPGPCPGMRVIGYGSAPIADVLLDRALGLFECDFVQTYGSTETCGVVAQLLPEDHRRAAGRGHLLRSVGRPVPGVEVRIGGGGTPPGEVGEILVRSPMVMSGYWRKPEKTAEVLGDDGWVRTGDLGSVDEESHLYLADRRDDMIISGGENIYPAEVENVVARHGGVAEVAVVGVPDAQWGEAVVAFVVRRPDQAVSADEVVAFARRHLAGFRCPKRVVFVDHLPKNATGKVLRRTLRDGYTSSTNS